MVTLTSLAETASLMGDPARAAILYALLDGRAFTAGELARVAGVTAPTASGHLIRLEGAGMLAAERQGRHRYYRLASTDIAAILESLLLVTAHRTAASRAIRRPGPRDVALRRARICYDHLAGELGVALFNALVDRNALQLSPRGAALTSKGEAIMADLGVLGGRNRSGGAAAACRPCLDWSERRHHLAGFVGASFLATALERGWLQRLGGTRAVEITRAGSAMLSERLGLSGAWGSPGCQG
jgi:DNA-binding transcriptional ArsR family regulator